jgi:SAM-dependent methyltransferase
VTVSRHVEPSYLRPYRDAAAAHGAGFGTLLWASPQTQAVRFEAIRRAVDLNGKSVLDVGCGRADLLEYLLGRGVRPADYVGIEAVGDLAAAAEAKRLPRATIARADFVAEPVRLFVGADVVVFSGSLNTADDSVFYSTLTRAWDAAAETLVFNYLCSPLLAGREYLYWRHPADVTRFARALAHDVRTDDEYLPGDMTVRLHRADEDTAP